jgi:polysaccharide export outer membrane protein
MNGLQWVGIAGAALLVVGCESIPAPADIAGEDRTLSNVMEYRIGVDDRLQVTVWRNPELTVTVPVRPDGKITVPLIGDVGVGGHAPSEVAENIKKQLSAYLREPNVAVIVMDMRSGEYLTRVRVTGAVRAPRSVPHRQGMTVLDVVLDAGGLNDFASPNRTKVYRKTKGKTEVFDIELGDILNKGRLETNLMLKPGDVVTVPERMF